MKILELFCGTKSFSKQFPEAETITLDYDITFAPTICEDIITWDYKQYPPDYFNTIWVSPDCTTWSIATRGKYRTKANIYGHSGVYQDLAEHANEMIMAVINILNYYSPSNWYIENPRGLLNHFPPFNEFLSDKAGYKTLVYYGNYGWGFPKPTHIWSNHYLWENEKMPVLDDSTYIKSSNPSRLGKRDYKKWNWAKSRDRSQIPELLINKIITTHNLQ